MKSASGKVIAVSTAAWPSCEERPMARSVIVLGAKRHRSAGRSAKREGGEVNDIVSAACLSFTNEQLPPQLTVTAE
jgi:hypothetical protein